MSLRVLLLVGAIVIAQSTVVANVAQADEYVQIGTGSASSGTGIGARTTMTAPAPGPNYPSGTPTRFYWVGTTLSDGTFIQAGYEDPALDSDCASLRWFFYAQRAGTVLAWDHGACGLTGTRQFELVNNGYDTGLQRYVWRARLGGTLIGSPIYSSSYTLPAGATGVISEVSTSGTFNHSGMPGLPSVVYDVAVQIRLASGSWINASKGNVHRSSGVPFYTPCPPYEIYDLGSDKVEVLSDTSPLFCYANGTTLW